VIRSLRLLVIALVGVCLGACRASPPPLDPNRLSRDDCLKDVRVDALEKALLACDQVVAQFPQDPQPLNDRFVLHSLNEDPKQPAGISIKPPPCSIAVRSMGIPSWALMSASARKAAASVPRCRSRCVNPADQAQLYPAFEQLPNHGRQGPPPQAGLPPFKQQGDAFGLAGDQAIDQLIGNAKLEPVAGQGARHADAMATVFGLLGVAWGPGDARSGSRGLRGAG